MAVVLSSEDSGFFTSESPLKRSHSQPKFLSNPSTDLRTSASTSQLHNSQGGRFRKSYHVPADSSPSSSVQSSPRTIHADSINPSYSSTPVTNLSLDDHCGDDLDENIILPTYDDNPFFAHIEDLEAPPSPGTGDSYTASPAATTSRPESPEVPDHAEDDTAISRRPTQHVDYLSHDWREEDIWSSWRYIVSKRGEYANSSRLENASWRTWMKAKYDLKTVSPETLNWLKDCDVTWLYGPLQTQQTKLTDTEQSSSMLSRTDSFINKKPILKKRSMSEAMLQKSLSASSLLKQATASVQAQQDDGMRKARPILTRTRTDFMTFPFASRRISNDNTSLYPSNTTSGVVTPSTERKHIHFDEQVQQCIAVEIKGEEDEDDIEPAYLNYDDDSDSDDGAIMMKRSKSTKTPFRPRPKPRANSSSESKTIAMLPSTTLKYREDTPEPPETAMKHSTGTSRNSFLSPSSSQETLRPSKQSGRFFMDDSDEDDEDDDEENKKSSTASASTSADNQSTTRQSGLQRSASTGSLTGEAAGMRRTESGMLMPYDEGDNNGNEGIIGRVIDTVNTARDIAHVIWNVGWRR
ncbi:hypothetical protein BX600DRAFT_432510 [Xylariales sp. PMI_506]|nr:hypothetical protein BX600DRAFT_432510 [Xylariales sp. PMI_506]